MSKPYSRDSFADLARVHEYVSVRFKQGVPLTDADLNEAHDVQRHELRSFLKWFVGDGVPFGDNGFEIGVADGALTIALGRCLVDGMEVVNRPRPNQAGEVQEGPLAFEAQEYASHFIVRMADGRIERRAVVREADADVEDLGLEFTAVNIAVDVEIDEVINVVASSDALRLNRMMGGFEGEVLVEPAIVYRGPAEEDGDREDLVYLAVWEREIGQNEHQKLVPQDGESGFTDPRLGVETVRRVRREWAVRMARGGTEQPATLPALPDDNPLEIRYLPLARVRRPAGQATIEIDDLREDLRVVGVNVQQLSEALQALEAKTDEGLESLNRRMTTAETSHDALRRAVLSVPSWHIEELFPPMVVVAMRQWVLATYAETESSRVLAVVHDQPTAGQRLVAYRWERSSVGWESRVQVTTLSDADGSRYQDLDSVAIGETVHLFVGKSGWQNDSAASPSVLEIHRLDGDEWTRREDDLHLFPAVIRSIAAVRLINTERLLVAATSVGGEPTLGFVEIRRDDLEPVGFNTLNWPSYRNRPIALAYRNSIAGAIVPGLGAGNIRVRPQLWVGLPDNRVEESLLHRDEDGSWIPNEHTRLRVDDACPRLGGEASIDHLGVCRTAAGFGAWVFSADGLAARARYAGPETDAESTREGFSALAQPPFACGRSKAGTVFIYRHQNSIVAMSIGEPYGLFGVM